MTGDLMDPGTPKPQLEDLEAWAAKQKPSVWQRITNPFRNWRTHRRYGKP